MSDYVIRRLSVDEKRPVFDCGDDDLNDFFAIDSVVSAKQLLSVTYTVEIDNVLADFFSLSNDAVKKELLDRPIYNRLTRIILSRKRYATLPAVKIGRLATGVAYQSSGIGSEIIDYLKYWFTDGNKTGCRFIIVDAYNNDKTIHFYLKNDFSFLLPSDDKKNPFDDF